MSEGKTPEIEVVAFDAFDNRVRAGMACKAPYHDMDSGKTVLLDGKVVEVVADMKVSIGFLGIETKMMRSPNIVVYKKD